jgi:hypothetical protein
LSSPALSTLDLVVIGTYFVLAFFAVFCIPFAFSVLEILSLHFTIIAGLLVLVFTVIFVGVSVVSRPPLEEQVRQFTYTLKPWSGSPRLAGGRIIVFTACYW